MTLPPHAAFRCARLILGLLPLLAAGCMTAPEITQAPAARHLTNDEPSRFDGRWRTARSTLHLAPPGPLSRPAPFAFSGLQAARTEIEIALPRGVSGIRMHLACDGPLVVDGVARPAGKVFELTVGAPDGKARTVLRPADGLGRCAGAAYFPQGRRDVLLVRQETADPALARLDSRFDTCGAVMPAGADALERAFHAPRALSQTCPFDPGRSRLLTGPRAGFDAKVAALLGRALPPDFYETGDPERPLDFSAAPALSLIYLSYLDMKADFSGRVIERLVRHHAARGTTVRIMVSDVLTRDKDRYLLENLAADHHNVQVKTVRWSPPPLSPPREQIARLHRVHHAKLLIALSPTAGRSAAILGGRNIHDGFLFPQPLDLSAYPKLQHYGHEGSKLNYYSNWSDLDLALYDDAAARLLAAHLSTLWHGDAATGAARPFSTATKQRAPARGTGRHFISVPYADGHALEAYYVDLLDAARRSIEIVNPYLSLTAPLEAALERALARGVEVAIIGRVDLSGDLGGRTMTAMNQAFVERFGGRVTIHDFKEPRLLLHAKMLMIDRRLSVLSSVNLNNRSFIHDSENGLAALDPEFYARMKKIFEDYRAASVRITTARPAFYWRLMSLSRLVREAL